MAKFYGIGVGPGDPELLTIKAVNILKKVDVLLIPQTKKGEKGVAYTIAEPYLKDSLEIIYIDFPMVIDEEVFVRAGEKAGKIILEMTETGKNVAFIGTIDSTSFFSTKGRLAIAAAAQKDVIPGIVSTSTPSGNCFTIYP